jgi:hypothetical protein
MDPMKLSVEFAVVLKVISALLSEIFLIEVKVELSADSSTVTAIVLPLAELVFIKNVIILPSPGMTLTPVPLAADPPMVVAVAEKANASPVSMVS